MSKVKNFGRFYKALNYLNYADKEDLKCELVLKYTNNRTSSLKEIKEHEYIRLCDDLETRMQESEERRMLRAARSNVLHQLQIVGVNTADWNDINAFCRSPRLVGKEFRELDIEDLDKLYKKLRAIRAKKEKEEQNG